VKFFIMVLSLIEEFEVRQKKLVCQNNAILKGGSDRENSLDHHVLNEKLAESLSLVLVTLLILHIVSYGSFFYFIFLIIMFLKSCYRRLCGPHISAQAQSGASRR
jgi:hypothetical protein